MRRTKFPFLLWHWTLGSENLFELDRGALEIYQLIVTEASNGSAQAK